MESIKIASWPHLFWLSPSITLKLYTNSSSFHFTSYSAVEDFKRRVSTEEEPLEMTACIR